MLSSFKVAIADRLRHLVRGRDGNIAMIFALAAIPVIVGAGIAVDVGRAYLVRLQLEAALDSAALAVASSQGLTAAQLQTRLQSYFDSNYPMLRQTQDLSVTMTDPTQPVINVTASVQLPTTFLRLISVNQFPVSASNQVSKGTNALELALVLDNTGSMMCGDGSGAGGSPCNTPAHITALKTDAQSIVDTLFSDSTDPTKLKISVVPYVTSVNVGGALCGGGTSCTDIATDCYGGFTTDTGNTIYSPSTEFPPPSASYTGNTTQNSKTVTNLSPSITGKVYPGMTVTGSGIRSGTTVASVSGSQITLSSNATSTRSGDSLTISGIVGYWSTSSNVVTVVYPPLSTLGLTASQSVVSVGTGLGFANASGVYYAPAQGASVNLTNNTLTLCQGENPSQSAGSASSPVQLTIYHPVVYDTSNNPTTTNWKGCVVEPTWSGEDSTGNGPDINEIGGGWTTSSMKNPWWAFYWTNGGSSSYSASNNTWWIPSSGTSVVYDQILGNVITATNSSYGPNLSCPTPLVRLTSDQETLDSTMQDMRAWDNSGTAITVGMIWGWRTLSPNAPFKDGAAYNSP
ncbi:MAG TPA: TadE/TadG family type IV pilus assembly protein, partial [Mycobacterium sp.]|nr:TadE/TadG family type IV pilus assembly protein [Mycobacterium sp.]